MGEYVGAGAGCAEGSGSVGVPTIAMRSYLSTQHLWTAEHFTRLARELEAAHTGESRFAVRHRAYVLGAVGESVAFLEAFINELFQDAADGAGVADGLSPDMVRLMTEYWRTTEQGKSVEVTKKYDMARVFAGHPHADAGRRPNEDVKYLVKLRNWSVHYRPRTVSEKDPHKLIDHVQGRFADNAFMTRQQEHVVPRPRPRSRVRRVGRGLGAGVRRRVRHPRRVPGQLPDSRAARRAAVGRTARSRFPITYPVVRSPLIAPSAGRQGCDLRKLVRRVGIEPTTRWLGVA